MKNKEFRKWARFEIERLKDQVIRNSIEMEKKIRDLKAENKRLKEEVKTKNAHFSRHNSEVYKSSTPSPETIKAYYEK